MAEGEKEVAVSIIIKGVLRNIREETHGEK